MFTDEDYILDPEDNVVENKGVLAVLQALGTELDSYKRNKRLRLEYACHLLHAAEMLLQYKNQNLESIVEENFKGMRARAIAAHSCGELEG